jgi:hypothetical protein
MVSSTSTPHYIRIEGHGEVLKISDKKKKLCKFRMLVSHQFGNMSRTGMRNSYRCEDSIQLIYFLHKQVKILCQHNDKIYIDAEKNSIQN